MPVFAYKALRADGVPTLGQVEAAGRQEAMANLNREGLQPVQLTETTAPSRTATVRHGNHRVSAKALENFTRQLASLLAAGVPLAQGLQLLCQESTENSGREHWQAIHDAVVDGTPLFEAMGRQPQVFPRVYVAMVKAGETGGFLDLVLRQIADFQSLERELRSRVVSALVYPAVLAGLSTAVLIFLMVFFIPRFQGIFKDFGAALPPLTRFIVEASLTTQRYGVPFLVLLGIGGLALRRYLDGVAGRQQTDRLTLLLPIVGSIAARFAMVRFCRMLGTLTQAGVPLINALRVARESIANEILADTVASAITRVQHGERLGASLAASARLFPPTVIAMITVGEQTGRMGEELVRLAADAEKDLDRQLRAAVTLAEPALLFVMAAIVGTIVIGMVLPIFTIQEYIK